ncbi:hypothetical protein ACFWC9_10765 [Streptomyces goshikiensis]|uniref:hypothetical protein n=1 Tax=Streptomyces goshikiensis TaxID=1942 RepID=UPI0036BEFE55
MALLNHGSILRSPEVRQTQERRLQTSLGIALGTALTARRTLWWISGTLALMWALMFFLPKRPSSQAG